MNVIYDNEFDALYLKLEDEKPEWITEISEGIHLSATHDGKIIGIEITDASERLDIKAILSHYEDS